MNGVDYTSKLNRQREIYQKNLDDANRNHKEQVEHLKETHSQSNAQRSKAHRDAVLAKEKGFEKTITNMREKQADILKRKSRDYELTTQENIDKFHKERTKNRNEWNRKFSNLSKEFSQNLEQTEKSSKARENQMKANYDQSVKDVRAVANKDLNNFIETTNASKDATSNPHAVEKDQMRQEFNQKYNDLLQTEMDKRNFILSNAAQDSQANKETTEKNYIRSKNAQEKKFREMVDQQDKRIDTAITQREDRWNSNLQRSELDRNREFSKRYEELSQLYDKNVRDIQLKNRAEKLTRGERNKELEKNYRENLANQFQNQKETLLGERDKLTKTYDDRIDNIVSSYQENIRKDNITHMGQMSELQGRMVEDARKEKFQSDLDKERIIHDNTVRIRYVEDKNEERMKDMKRLNDQKITNLKKDFSKSMEQAQKSSKKNFEETKNEMIKEKREIAQRLHEQNSKQNAYLRETHSDKMEKLIMSYDKRIADLELQNKIILQNSNDTIRDVMRKTAIEIDRQREIAMKSAENEVRTERQLGKEKLVSLQKRIDKMQHAFNEKINEQTLRSRKKVKDIHFELSNKLVTESQRYQEIIDQNNKFFARELQRLQMATSNERERLITQYEDRITQLKKAYSQRMEEMKASVRVENA